MTLMDAYDETIQSWNKAAGAYEQKFMHLDIYDATYDRFISLLPPGPARVLDVACGPGNISRYLLRKRPGIDIEGIDAAPGMIALAQKNNPEGRFYVKDVRGLSSVTGTFNGIICGFVLPYLTATDCAALIRDARNRLGRNGILYVSFVEGEAERSGYITGSTGLNMYFYYHQAKQVQAQLLENGFDVCDTLTVAYPAAIGTDTHTILIGRKR